MRTISLTPAISSFLILLIVVVVVRPSLYGSVCSSLPCRLRRRVVPAFIVFRKDSGWPCSARGYFSRRQIVERFDRVAFPLTKAREEDRGVVPEKVIMGPHFLLYCTSHKSSSIFSLPENRRTVDSSDGIDYGTLTQRGSFDYDSQFQVIRAGQKFRATVKIEIERHLIPSVFIKGITRILVARDITSSQQDRPRNTKIEFRICVGSREHSAKEQSGRRTL